MKKTGLFLVIATCALLATTHAQIPAALESRLQSVLDSLAGRYNIKGASAAVLIPGKGTWKGTSGVSHNGQPITTDMVFGIGSNTKTMTATLLLKMQENGLLDLEDTIGTWIKNVPNVSGTITIRQLLSHTSGLYNYTNNVVFITAVTNYDTVFWKPEDILPYIDTPYFAPGSSWNYSNTNYLLAGLIIQNVLNQPLHQAFRNYLLQPQGLTSTYFVPHETPAHPVPHYWSVYFAQPQRLTDLVDAYNYSLNAGFSMAWAAGAVMATAEDNVTFWHRLMTGQIIHAALLQEMQQFRTISASKAYGLGLYRLKSVNGRVAFSHGGTNVGFINENLVDSANGVCVAVLTNQDSISNAVLLQQVVTALHRETLASALTVINNVGLPAVRVSVFPNPTSGLLKVAVQATCPLTLQLTDATGRVLLEKPAAAEQTFQTTGMAPGTYRLRALHGDHVVASEAVVLY